MQYTTTPASDPAVKPLSHSITFPLAEAASRIVGMVHSGAPRPDSGCLAPSVATVETAAEIWTSHRVISSAMEYISSHTGQSFSICDLATHVGCSRSTLERRFRQAFGKTVLTTIREHRIETAKRLLATSTAPIHRIALQVGFGTNAQFHVVFNRLVGMTPMAFRRATTRQV